MLALVLASFLVAQTPQRGPVDDKIENADLIVIAKVTKTPTIRGQGDELAELAIERVLFGPPLEHVFAVARDNKERAPSRGLAAGKSYVLFLEQANAAGIARKGNERAVESLLGGVPVYFFESDASWLIANGRVTMPDAMLPARSALPATLDELSPWLVERIDRSLPSIRATIVSTSPLGNPSVLVTPDGSVSGRATDARLGAEEMRALWERVETAGFDTLPGVVNGGSRAPCAPIWVLEVRGREGRKVVDMHGSDLQGLDAKDRDTAQRFLRIWELMPLDTRAR